MNKYEIITIHDGETGQLSYAIYNTISHAYFAGYNNMGGEEWEPAISESCEFTAEDDPWQIMQDLESADAPIENPEDKKYLFRAMLDGQWQISVETGNRIADIYDLDQDCGIYGDMEVWDISGEPKQINLLDLVSPILHQRRWMQQEYRDYCDAVNEYGYDFEWRNE